MSFARRGRHETAPAQAALARAALPAAVGFAQVAADAVGVDLDAEAAQATGAVGAIAGAEEAAVEGAAGGAADPGRRAAGGAAEAHVAIAIAARVVAERGRVRAARALVRPRRDARLVGVTAGLAGAGLLVARATAAGVVQAGLVAEAAGAGGEEGGGPLAASHGAAEVGVLAVLEGGDEHSGGAGVAGWAGGAEAEDAGEGAAGEGEDLSAVRGHFAAFAGPCPVRVGEVAGVVDAIEARRERHGGVFRPPRGLEAGPMHGFDVGRQLLEVFLVQRAGWLQLGGGGAVGEHDGFGIGGGVEAAHWTAVDGPGGHVVLGPERGGPSPFDGGSPGDGGDQRSVRIRDEIIRI